MTSSSYRIDVINFTLKLKHMLVENKHNWFCSSVCSETPVIMNGKNDIIRGFPFEQIQCIILILMRESKEIYFQNFFLQGRCF